MIILGSRGGGGGGGPLRSLGEPLAKNTNHDYILK